jgi:hypothetical protein
VRIVGGQPVAVFLTGHALSVQDRCFTKLSKSVTLAEL